MDDIEVEKLFGKDYTEFSEVDPFNPKNEVSGYISRKATEYYGAIIINKVNNISVKPQLIMGTPKMHYPFVSRADNSRNYLFPSCRKIEIYEKLDGTNVLAFGYTDSKGNYFISYKTRLRPFLMAGRFGDFLSMWKQVGLSYEREIVSIMTKYNVNLSFELYGSKNPHLIIYPNALDIAFLFGVSNAGNIVPPSKIETNLPKVGLIAVIDKDYVWNYEELQKKMNNSLSTVEEEHYSGQEGAVWYLNIQDRWVQVKCKPEIVETIHFAAGTGGICKNSILTTCWNAYENTDNPDVNFVKNLLLEEFEQSEIEANAALIEKCLFEVKEQLIFKERVQRLYKETGMNILLQKREVMRILSPNFSKKEMGIVFSIISNMG